MSKRKKTTTTKRLQFLALSFSVVNVWSCMLKLCVCNVMITCDSYEGCSMWLSVSRPAI